MTLGVEGDNELWSTGVRMMEAQVRAEQHSCEEANRQGSKVLSACKVNLGAHWALEFWMRLNLYSCQECLMGILRQELPEEKVPRWEAAVARNSSWD